MIRSYRVYRNMNEPDKVAKPVCIELLTFSSLWVWLVAELEESVSECCSMMHEIPLPKWIVDWTFETSEGDILTIGDYYGDDLGGLWHCYVESPLSDYVFEHTRRTLHHVNVSLKDMGEDEEIQWIVAEIERESRGEGRDYNWQDNPGTSTLFKVMEFLTRPFRKPNGNGNQNQS